MHGRTSVRTFRTFRYHCQIELVVLVFLSFLFFCWAFNANIFRRVAPFEANQSGTAHATTDRRSDYIRFKLDLNEADKAELTLLPRIGATIAERIVEYRSKNGNFENVDVLLNIKGIGPKTLARIRPYCQASKSTQKQSGTDLDEAIPDNQ